MSEFNSAPLLRISIPALERLRQLYAFGYTNSEMAEIINQEFGDIQYDTFTASRVKDTILNNKELFRSAQMELGLKCREDIQNQIAAMFAVVGKKEIFMVQVFADKLQAALESLQNLDLDEIDPETGNYTNTARIFVLLEMAEKFQAKIAKIVGTDTLRSIEEYRAKMAIKSEADSKVNQLIPEFGRNVTPTKFV